MEERILTTLQKAGQPMDVDEIITQLGGDETIANALDGLIKNGRIILTRKKKLALPEQTGLTCGTVQGNARGFGFFIPDDGGGDTFIPAEGMNGAMHGDRVWARIGEKHKKTGMSDTEVSAIAKRAYTKIVGLFESDMHIGGYVVPDEVRLHMDVLVKKEDVCGAKPGDKVVATILQYPDGRRPMSGKITEILGNRFDPGADILSIVRQYDLVEEFSKSASRQARSFKPPNDDDLLRRNDLRRLTVVTVDGADAKGLDDAISLSHLQNGNLLVGVHIADVSAYVHPGTALDNDAYARATSVYLLDRVIPMLPPDLSNGLCSLNPGEDKLTLSCMMELTPSGRMVSHTFLEAIINTRHRMTYDDVDEIISGNELEAYSDVAQMVRDIYSLTGALSAIRSKRGSIDFDLRETQITLDKKGRTQEVSAIERGAASHMIEELMLLANVTAAEHIMRMGKPCMYRIHEMPTEVRQEQLNTLLASCGYNVKKAKDLKPQTYRKILMGVKGRPEETVVSRAILRSMQRARYSPEALGHFGLALDYYCHFTSPIRRYPDIFVHRVLKEILHGDDNGRIAKLTKEITQVADHCSQRERVAAEAERAVMDLKKCEYMQAHVGGVYTAIISAIVPYGFLVQLSNTVEGVVRLNSLTGDTFTVTQQKCAVVGKNTGKTYTLGDSVDVEVLSVDMGARNIDFALCGKGKLQNRTNAAANDAPKVAPQPAKSAPQPPKVAPQPAKSAQQPVKATPQPVKAAQQPAKAAQQPAKATPQQAKVAPQPVKAAPQQAKSAPQPDKASVAAPVKASTQAQGGNQAGGAPVATDLKSPTQVTVKKKSYKRRKKKPATPVEKV